jgi:hypothetical protein
MALSNYTELQASVASWMNRTDLAAHIPDFIAIAESRINAEVRLREGIVSAALATTPSSMAVALPTDWQEFASLTINDVPLEYVPANTIRERAKESNSGYPALYSIEGESLLLSPTPGVTPFNVNVTYYATIPSLATTATNWLLTKYPMIYLYGAMVSGFQFLLNTERADYWGLLYTQAKDLAKATDNRARSSGSPLRMRVK